jgi:co-chaperonin GroES (HSP10)
MKKIVPVGENLLVLPLPKENEQSDGGLIMVENTLTKGKVMEVSHEYYDVYKKGDIVIYPESAGIHQYYKSQNCIWLNATGFPKGHIVGIIGEEKEKV